MYTRLVSGCQFTVAPRLSKVARAGTSIRSCRITGAVGKSGTWPFTTRPIGWPWAYAVLGQARIITAAKPVMMLYFKIFFSEVVKENHSRWFLILLHVTKYNKICGELHHEKPAIIDL